MRSKVVCDCCSLEAKCESTNNISHVVAQTGFTPIIKIDTSFAWLCPQCKEKLVPHILAIKAMFKKPESIYWNCLHSLTPESKEKL